MSTASAAVVDVEWIAARLGDPDVRLIEVDVSRAAYDEGHIPGAVLWNAYADLRDSGYQLISDEELRGLMARSGIGPETHGDLYGYGAHLGFWLLHAIGHDRRSDDDGATRAVDRVRPRVEHRTAGSG